MRYNRVVRIACLGGGPGGLCLAILAKRVAPSWSVEVWDRNPPGETYGFGVVFSDEAMEAIRARRRPVARAIRAECASWGEIDVHFRGRVVHLRRPRVLGDRRARGWCADAGARSRTRRRPAPRERGAAIPTTCRLRPDRRRRRGAVRGACEVRVDVPADVDLGRCKFIWLATERAYDAFKFFIVETPHGIVQVHAYPTTSTSRRSSSRCTRTSGGARLRPVRGRGAEPGRERLGEHRDRRASCSPRSSAATLLANNSKWLNFPTVRNARWHHGNVVLLGDAAHTAHFSIGSGDEARDGGRDRARRGAASSTPRRRRRRWPPTRRSGGRSSRARSARRRPAWQWFEDIGRYVDQDADAVRVQPAHPQPPHHLRQPAAARPGVRRAGGRVVRASVARQLRDAPRRAADVQPFRLRELELPNRVVVSPMDMYSAVDGVRRRLPPRPPRRRARSAARGW